MTQRLREEARDDIETQVSPDPHFTFTTAAALTAQTTPNWPADGEGGGWQVALRGLQVFAAARLPAL